MKSSNGLEQARHAKYHEFRQLEYFKQIFKGNSDFQMKEILPNYIFKLSTKNFHHDSFIYLPDKNIDELESGVPISPSIREFPKKVGVVRISRHLDTILRSAISIKIPIIEKYKSQERFALLSSTCIQEYPFNRIFYKKGDQFQGVYFIIQGFVKEICAKTGQIIRNFNAGSYFGLEELSTDQPSYLNTTISTFNSTKVIFFTIEALSFVFESQDALLKDLLKDYYKHLACKSQAQKQKYQKKRAQTLAAKNKKNDPPIKPIKITTFAKRCDGFTEKTTEKDPGFNDFVRKKKILLKLKQSMQLYKENRKPPCNSPISPFFNQKRNKKISDLDQWSDSSLKKRERRSDLMSINLKKKLQDLYLQRQEQKQQMVITSSSFRIANLASSNTPNSQV